MDLSNFAVFYFQVTSSIRNYVSKFDHIFFCHYHLLIIPCHMFHLSLSFLSYSNSWDIRIFVIFMFPCQDFKIKRGNRGNCNFCITQKPLWFKVSKKSQAMYHLWSFSSEHIWQPENTWLENTNLTSSFFYPFFVCNYNFHKERLIAKTKIKSDLWADLDYSLLKYIFSKAVSWIK